MTDTAPETDTDAGQAEARAVQLPARTSPDPVARATDFVREHPVLVVAGGLALGALAAALLPKGNRSKLLRRAVTLAEAASAASVLIGKQARDKAEAAGHGIRERGGVAARGLERLGEAASGRLQDAIETAGDAGAKAGKRIAATAGEVRSRLRR